ncbi:hypothetical protein, partial [Streptomyces sp. st140]|uniref:hypothetical protein n=1 Tax=Streptomyces sp. st140 TaxID=1828052 RepID=UPI00359F965D
MRHAVVRPVLVVGGGRCGAALGGDDELARVVVAGLVGPAAVRALALGVAGRGVRAGRTRGGGDPRTGTGRAGICLL